YWDYFDRAQEKFFLEGEKNPIVINQDPYNKGWLVKMKMSNPEEIKQLQTGPQAIQKLKDLIASEKLTCKRL
ncbi:hypothetical protein DJ524_09575, partial [Sulfolobus sp. D5]